MSRHRLTCGITMGDAAGIGPEVTLKALNDKRIQRLADFVLIGNRKVFARTAAISKLKIPANVTLVDIPGISKVIFGKGIAAYGQLALDCLKTALRLLKAKKINVLVTAPVNKHTINQSGYPFQGHTEYLARASRTKNFAMMLLGGPLKVVLVTRHIPLKQVPKALTKKKIYQTIALTVFALRQYFGIAHPRIGVCGLNPHSGDKGIMGQEESKVIRPAVVQAAHLGKISGPMPADSLFYLAAHNKFDACLAMYHDQGLIPLKTVAFNQGVNLTLGLPFVRTSPDHGTAYDLAGKDKADSGSMKEAIKLAVKIGLRIKK